MAFYRRDGRRREFQCQRCPHRWAPRALEWPNLCPKCKSRLWFTKRTSYQGLRAGLGRLQHVPRPGTKQTA
jgi:hypothetical protein